MSKHWEIIIIGGGPAGLAAALYCGRALRSTLIIEKYFFGGQIITSDIIENYPGYTDPQSPADLMERFIFQVKKYGVEMENNEVIKIEREGETWRVNTNDGFSTTDAIILATGSEHRFLGVEGEKELRGRGLSVCATCDAPFFKDRRIAVIGGGDTAIAEALHLAKFASDVTIIHRRDQLRAERILQERAFHNNKIKFLWNREVLRFKGFKRLESIQVKDKISGNIEEFAFDGIFMAIGTVPTTELVKNLVDLDAEGYISTDISLKTSSPGIFVAGEVVKGNHRQVAISAGMGVQASLSCEEYLNTLPKK